MNLTKSYIRTLATIFVPKRYIYGGKGATKIQPAMSIFAKDAAKRIVWVDLEMTGLDIDNDHIMEIACLVTDSQLNMVSVGPDLIIHQPDDILNNMNPWCIAQHGESGLTEASRKSKISLKEAEDKVLDFIKAHAPEKKCPLAGNSVYMDRLFLRKYMPRVDNYLHYRIIDVSTIKELGKRWYQKEFSNLPAKSLNIGLWKTLWRALRN